MKTNQQILEKATQKAIAGGWGPWNAPIKVGADLAFYIDGERWNLEAVIFNHDFAKALWGDAEVQTAWTLLDGTERLLDARLAAWKHHLMQMVIADDPIKYLSEHI